METLDNIEVFIDPGEVMRYQGYQGDLGKLPPAIAETLKTALEEGQRLARPRAIYDLLAVREVAEGSLVLDSGLVLTGESIGRAWRSALYLGVAICTIGPALEGKVSGLFGEGDYALSLMLDSVGTEAVENAASRVQDVICEKASSLDMQVGIRLSPGERWDLGQQRAIFSLLPAERIGVRLTSHCMMIPQKSISFCVGAGREIRTETKAHNCQRCSLKSCRYRRVDAAPV